MTPYAATSSFNPASGLALSLADLEAFDPQHPRRAGESRACCPFCGPAKPIDAAHRCFAYNGQTGAWTCWRCHAKGLLKEFWTEREKPIRDECKGKGSRRSASRAALARFSLAALPTPSYPNLSAPLPSSTRTYPKHLEQVPDPNSPAPTSSPATSATWRDKLPQTMHRLTSPAAKAGAAYLEGRGLTSDFCEAEGVRFAGSFFGRPAVMFGLRNATGQSVGAQGRFIDKQGGGPRMLTIGSRKEGVYLTRGALSDGGAVVFTEAPIDALSLASVGLPALSLCGCSGVPEWLLQSCAFRDGGSDRGIVIAAFDADDAGNKAVITLTALLQPYGARVVRLVPPDSMKDFNEALQRLDVSTLTGYVTGCLLKLCGGMACQIVQGQEARHVIGVQAAALWSRQNAPDSDLLRALQKLKEIRARCGDGWQESEDAAPLLQVIDAEAARFANFSNDNDGMD